MSTRVDNCFGCKFEQPVIVNDAEYWFCVNEDNLAFFLVDNVCECTGVSVRNRAVKCGYHNTITAYRLWKRKPSDLCIGYVCVGD